MYTIHEVKQRLAMMYTELDIIEMLQIDTEMLVEAFHDEIAERMDVLIEKVMEERIDDIAD